MFGHLELVGVLVILGLVIFGPRRMMEMASSIGRAVGQLQKASRDFKDIGSFSLSDEEHQSKVGSVSSIPSVPPTTSHTVDHADV